MITDYWSFTTNNFPELASAVNNYLNHDNGGSGRLCYSSDESSTIIPNCGIKAETHSPRLSTTSDVVAHFYPDVHNQQPQQQSSTHINNINNNHLVVRGDVNCVAEMPDQNFQMSRYYAYPGVNPMNFPSYLMNPQQSSSSSSDGRNWPSHNQGQHSCSSVENRTSSQEISGNSIIYWPPVVVTTPGEEEKSKK